jgi:hypothetical protein
MIRVSITMATIIAMTINAGGKVFGGECFYKGIAM